MKILITVPKFNWGGVLPVVDAIIPFLGEVDKVKRGRNKHGENKLLVGIKQIAIFFIFIKKLIVTKYDLVIINTSIGRYSALRDGLFVTIAKIFRKSTILYVHGYKKNVLKNIIFKFGYFKADKIIVLSYELEKLIKKFGYLKAVSATVNPVDISLLENNFLNKPKDIINLLYFGRIEKEKGILIALEAFQLAQKNIQNINFTIAGHGNYLNSAKEFAKSMNITDTSFIGFVTGEDKIELLKKSHILIAPTFREGISVAILEAITAGLSIISRPVGGIKDFFLDSKMGYLVESLEPNDFAQCIAKTITNIGLVNSYNSNYAIKNFHPEQLAKKIIH